MASIATKLSQLEAGAPTQDRADAYNELLRSIIAARDELEDNLALYVQSITSDNIGVIHSRPLLSAFVDQFRNLSDNEVKIAAGFVASLINTALLQLLTLCTETKSCKF